MPVAVEIRQSDASTLYAQFIGRPRSELAVPFAQEKRQQTVPAAVKLDYSQIRLAILVKVPHC